MPLIYAQKRFRFIASRYRSFTRDSLSNWLDEISYRAAHQPHVVFDIDLALKIDASDTSSLPAAWISAHDGIFGFDGHRERHDEYEHSLRSSKMPVCSLSKTYGNELSFRCRMLSICDRRRSTLSRPYEISPIFKIPAADSSAQRDVMT